MIRSKADIGSSMAAELEGDMAGGQMSVLFILIDTKEQRDGFTSHKGGGA